MRRDANQPIHADIDGEHGIYRAIGIGRIVWGLILALSPGTVHRLLRVPFPGADGGVWVRVFGVRDVVLGLGALHPDAAVRRFTARVGVGADLADAAAIAVAARFGLPPRAVWVGMALAGGAALLGAVGPTALRAVASTRDRA